MRLPAVRLRRPVPAAEPEGAVRRARLPWRTWIRRLSRPGVPLLRRLVEAVRHNWGLKLVSLGLACFLWYSINELERDAERLVELPVAIRKVPPGLIVTDVLPAKGVTVTLRGPRTILDSVDEGKTRLVVDLSTASEGKVSVDLNRATLNPELPRRLKAVRMSPVRLDARLEPLAKRRIKVTASLVGEPALGYEAKPAITPDHVEVTGPASTVNALDDVITRRIDVTGLSAPLERNALLEPAGDFVTVVPDRVRVAVSIQEKTLEQEFKRVPIALRNGAAARVTPSQVTVAVRGPELVLHDWTLPEGAVFVDAGGLKPGTHELPVQVDLPAPLEVTARKPESVRVIVTPPKEQGGT
jgi:YbbR domain-containing protein